METTSNAAATRSIKFTKFGLGENPASLLVSYRRDGRDWLSFVDSTYRQNGPVNAIMLRVRAMNGERQNDVAAAAVRVLGPSGMFPTDRLEGVQR